MTVECSDSNPQRFAISYYLARKERSTTEVGCLPIALTILTDLKAYSRDRLNMRIRSQRGAIVNILLGHDSWRVLEWEIIGTVSLQALQSPPNVVTGSREREFLNLVSANLIA